MKVALHAVAATKQGASTEVIAGTLRGLRHAAPENEYVLFLHSALDIDLPAETSRVEAQPGGAASRILWDQVSYPRLLRRIGADVSVACFGFTAIRPGVPQVVILQNALYFCGIPKNSPYASSRSLGLERKLLHQIVRSADRVVVPSQTMADGVRPWLGNASTGAIVIPDAWEYDLADITERGWSEPWKLVYIAHLERHKAHLELIEIAAELKRRRRKVLISVGIDEKDDPEIYAVFTERVADQGLTEFFEIGGRVPREAVTKKMLAADCFISPTKCESFGYSYLEATGAALPVVSSDIPIAREMLGGGALYYGHVRAAADQIEKLAANPSLGSELIKRARIHQEQFTLTWEEYGAQLAEVISGVGTRHQ